MTFCVQKDVAHIVIFRSGEKLEHFKRSIINDECCIDFEKNKLAMRWTVAQSAERRLASTSRPFGKAKNENTWKGLLQPTSSPVILTIYLFSRALVFYLIDTKNIDSVL